VNRRTTRRIRTCLCTIAVAVLALGVVDCPAHAAGGTTYYVSPSGSDSADGLTTSAAFKTIQRCANVAQPGDTCQIMAGTYHETVTPPTSGTSGAPITFEPYGTDQVTVDGDDPVSGWQQVTSADLASLESADANLAASPFATAVGKGQMYRASVSVAAGLTGNEVFVDSTQENEAQWPDPGVDPLTPKEDYAGAGSAGTTIADPAITQPAGYWAGTYVYTHHWYSSQTQKVTGSAPGTLALTQAPGLGLAAYQTTYHLFGTMEAFSDPNQWYYDAAAQNLYLWSTTPLSSRVSVKQRSYAFDLNAASDITVRGLHIHAASIRTGPATTGDLLDALDVRYVSAFDQAANYIAGDSTSGIILDGTGNTVENSQIAYSSGNGVFLTGSANTVTNNVIHDVSSMGTYTGAVELLGNGQTVTHNTMFRLGRTGINLDSHLVAAPGPYLAENETIEYNDISSWGRRSTDTGALYACCSWNMAGSNIDHNWLHDQTAVPLVDPYSESGVYLDGGDTNGVGGATVWDNVGWDNGYLFGQTVFLNSNGKATKIYDNDGGVYTYNGALDSGTVIENNIGADQTPTTSGGVTVAHNLKSTVDPQYTDPATRRWNLKSTSPARNAAAVVSPFTDGFTDPAPSIGAYQYGAAYWTPGASISSNPYLIAATVGDGGALTLSDGATTQVPISGLNSDGSAATAQSVVYTPVDPTVVSIDPDGTVHALKPGVTAVLARFVAYGMNAIAPFTVTVLPSTNTVPAPWSVQNLGTDENGGPTGGFATFDGTNYTLATTGWEIWSNMDRGTLLYQPVTATNATVTDTVNSVDDASGSGPVIRDGSSATAKEVNLRVQAGGSQIQLAYRSDATLPGTTGVTVTVPAAMPQQLKLVKTGNSFSGYYYANGTWNLVGTINDVMGTSLEVGTAVFAGRYGGGGTSVSGLTVTTG